MLFFSLFYIYAVFCFSFILLIFPLRFSCFTSFIFALFLIFFFSSLVFFSFLFFRSLFIFLFNWTLYHPFFFHLFSSLFPFTFCLCFLLIYFNFFSYEYLKLNIIIINICISSFSYYPFFLSFFFFHQYISLRFSPIPCFIFLFHFFRKERKNFLYIFYILRSPFHYFFSSHRLTLFLPRCFVIRIRVTKHVRHLISDVTRTVSFSA